MTDLRSITAAILVGGLGTRLRAVVPFRQKVVAEVGGRPFLHYVLDQLTDSGVRHVVLCAGHMGDQVETAVGRTYGGARIDYSREEERLGTAGALRRALPLLASDPVLVMNGDSCCRVDLAEFAAWHDDRGALASIVLTEVDDTARYGRVSISDGGQVTGFEEKGAHRGRGLINAGVYLLGMRLLRALPGRIPASLERDAFPAWIGMGLFGYACSARFIDIGTPESYLDAERFFRMDGGPGVSGDR